MSNDSPIKSFLDQLASDSPTPGGGSASAACGAMGAALVQMVCRLTIGKKKYAEVEQQVKQILSQADQLQTECTQLMEADAASFDEVMAAYRLPRDSEEEKAARQTAIQAALKNATLTPLKTAKICAAVLDLCLPLVEIGNINAISDGGVAAQCALAGIKGASLNVFINITAIEDKEFCQQQRLAVETLLQEGTAKAEAVFSKVCQKIGAG